MNIIYDNIIFSLQKAGGISIYWTELIYRIQMYIFMNQKRHQNKYTTRKQYKF
jgi:hypothetical protein